MADTVTQVPETGRLNETKSGGTGVGPGRAPARRARPGKKIVLVVLALALVAISIPLYRHYIALESTDDAQIDGYIYPVSARVSGYVTRVMVDDNQYVQAGTVLVQFDPKDYEVALANAKAALANDQASAAVQVTNVPLTSVNTSSSLSTAQADVENARAGLAAAEWQFDAAQASLRQAEANDLKAQDDVNRYKPLAAKDEIPQRIVGSCEPSTIVSVQVGPLLHDGHTDASAAFCRKDLFFCFLSGICCWEVTPLAFEERKTVHPVAIPI